MKKRKDIKLNKSISSKEIFNKIYELCDSQDKKQFIQNLEILKKKVLDLEKKKGVAIIEVDTNETVIDIQNLENKEFNIKNENYTSFITTYRLEKYKSKNKKTINKKNIDYF